MEKHPDEASATYKLASHIFDAITKLPNCQITASGTENIAKEGPQILAFTHHNSWDVPALGLTVYRHTQRPVHFMTKEELIHLPVAGRLLSRAHGIPINRSGRPPREQLEQASEVLINGGLLAMAPEMYRINGRELGRIYPGVGYFAVKHSVEVVPVGIAGPHFEGRIGPILPRGLHVDCGEPLKVSREPGLSPKAVRLDMEQRQVRALKSTLDTAYDLHPADLD